MADAATLVPGQRTPESEGSVEGGNVTGRFPDVPQEVPPTPDFNMMVSGGPAPSSGEMPGPSVPSSEPPPTSEQTDLYRQAQQIVYPEADTSRSEAAIKKIEQAMADRQDLVNRQASRRRGETEEMGRYSDLLVDQRAAARPAPLQLPQAPDVQPRAFGDPGPGLLAQLHSVLLGAGQIFQQMQGLKGPHEAAVAALKGAFEGWQAGDSERANMALKVWEKEQKRLIDEHADRIRGYRELVEDQKLSWSQRMAMIELKAQEDQWDAMNAGASVRDWASVTGAYQEAEKLNETQKVRWAQTFLSAQKYSTELAQYRDAEARREQDRQERIRRESIPMEVRGQLSREGIDFMAATPTQIDAAGKAVDKRQQDLAAAERKATAEATQEVTAAESASGEFYDSTRGEIRSISKGEERADLARVKAGQPPLFKKLTSADAQLIDRLAVAPPILDELDRIIDKIAAAAPGENLTQGLVNRLRRVAGIGPDIANFTALKLDAALENAAAVSGGLPRIAVLHMIRGDAQPSEFQTKETAHSVNNVARVTIKNRLQSKTGDPDAMTKLSKGLTDYGTRRVRRTSDGKLFEINPGVPIYPGYELVK